MVMSNGVGILAWHTSGHEQFFQHFVESIRRTKAVLKAELSPGLVY